MLETIGFIGLGIMGKPMARNLQKAGYALVVQDRHQDVSAEFVAGGAHAVQYPREIAASCQIVITMLPDSSTACHRRCRSDASISGDWGTGRPRSLSLTYVSRGPCSSFRCSIERV